MDALTLVLFVLGLGFLIYGADVLVAGSSKLAARFGVSSLVIGLTVVAFGTSAPELVVSVISASKGQSDIALGNVAGSNIFNVLFILGGSALIAPLIVQQKLVRIDVPIMIAGSLLTLLLALDGTLGRLDGALLFSLVICYVIFSIVQSRKESEAVRAEYDALIDEVAISSSLTKNFGLILAGLAMLVLGSRWVVDGAVIIAQNLGVSELIISLTIIATGTSLPEVATSFMAAYRGERDIAVGNVVGSNIFNLFCVLGLSSMVSLKNLHVSDESIYFHLPIVLGISVACLPIFWTGYTISRWKGLLFLTYFVGYIAFTVVEAQNPNITAPATRYLALWLLPLIGMPLLVEWLMNHKKQHKIAS